MNKYVIKVMPMGVAQFVSGIRRNNTNLRLCNDANNALCFDTREDAEKALARVKRIFQTRTMGVMPRMGIDAVANW